MQNEFMRPVRTDQVDKSGFQDDIKATAQECIDLAKRFDCESVESLSASIKIKAKADKMTYHITGSFDAHVKQQCILSAKTMDTHLNDTFEAWYRDTSKITPFRQKKLDANIDIEEGEIRPEEEDPEIIRDGMLDMGEIVAQFLGLAIDPYPKSPDVKDGNHIEVKPEDKPNPFAKLAELKTEK